MTALALCLALAVQEEAAMDRAVREVVVLGGLLGAGTGAIIGNQSDNAGAGTAIGAALGALGGGMIGHGMEEQSQAAQRQQYPPATSTAKTKFCPIGGETYDEGVKYCPTHGVELKYKEQSTTTP